MKEPKGNMGNIKNFFYSLAGNIARAFSGVNILWQLSAVALTFIIVASDFDWKYFIYFHGTAIQQIFFPAVILGALLPILLPTGIWIAGIIKKNFKILNIAFALGQAAMAGYLISIFYKIFTGRLHPSLFAPVVSDISRQFRFGFLQSGVFWGWPSSHAAVAFSMAFAFIALYPKNQKVKIAALAYAFYVGLGVSMSIHWFSDFIAGAIFGAVIGAAVGHSFYLRSQKVSDII